MDILIIMRMNIFMMIVDIIMADTMMIMMDIMNSNSRMMDIIKRVVVRIDHVAEEEGPAQVHVVRREEDKVEERIRRENIIQEEEVGVDRQQRMQSLAKYGHQKMPNKRQKQRQPNRLRSRSLKCQKCEPIAPKRVFMPEKPLLQIDL